MCKLYHLFPDGTERREKSSEALESPGACISVNSITEYASIRSLNTL